MPRQTNDQVYELARNCVDRIKGQLGEGWDGFGRACGMIESAFSGLNIDNRAAFDAACSNIEDDRLAVICNELRLSSDDFIELYRDHIPPVSRIKR